MSDFLAKVTAQLDTRAAEGQMTSFLKDRTMKVKVDLDTGNVNINNFLNQIKAQFQSAGQSAGQNMVNAINSSLGSINTKNSEYTLKNLQRTLAAFKFDRSQINTITQSLDSMDLAVQKVETRIREGGQLNLKVTGIDELGRSVTVLKEFDQASGTLRNVGKNISQSFSEVSNAGKAMFNDLDVSKLNASMSALDANFVKLKGSINAESTELQRLKQELANISQIQGLDNQQAAFERITLRVNQLSASYKTAKAEAASAAAAQQLLSNKAVLGNQIETWMNKNTKAAKIYAQELKTLKTQLDSVENQGQLKSVSSAFKEIQTSAAASGVLGKSVFGQLASNFTKLSPLFGMGTAITKSISEVKSMISTVYQLDTALVDLQKTTMMNSSELNSFYGNANSIAKDMGVTTAEIINQAAAWSRLGYSSKEAAESMAKLSSQFAAISPGMDADKATEGLVSIMKAYDIEVDDVLDGVMSKINIIGNTAATSNSQIVEMLSRSSSAMAEANNSLEEAIALETAAFEITQDASSVGTAYKTIAMRIRGRQSLPPYGENHMPRCA